MAGEDTGGRGVAAVEVSGAEVAVVEGEEVEMAAVVAATGVGGEDVGCWRGSGARLRASATTFWAPGLWFTVKLNRSRMRNHLESIELRWRCECMKVSALWSVHTVKWRPRVYCSVLRSDQ